MAFPASELILNPDGSIYHLNIKPQQLAETVITVGDPDRVEKVTAHFDEIEFSQRKREFHIQTGYFKEKRITVVSTGIGTDNIDIVLNELDALANIDFETREVKKKHTSLKIIRLGTTGSLQENVPIGSILISKAAIGFDGLAHFYKFQQQSASALGKFIQDLDYAEEKSRPYFSEADQGLLDQFNADEVNVGITATNPGFYAPQGRQLRGKVSDPDFIQRLSTVNFNGNQISNLEMETAGIYFLSNLLGHQALSINAVLANRLTGGFSKKPQAITTKMIKWTLEKLAQL
jgi:uridine phosphorylase